MSGRSGSRGEKLLSLCSSSASSFMKKQHAIVKVLQLNKYCIIPEIEIKPGPTRELITVKLQSTEYDAIKVLTGDEDTMRDSLHQILTYEKSLSQYKIRSSKTQFTQTEEVTSYQTSRTCNEYRGEPEENQNTAGVGLTTTVEGVNVVTCQPDLYSLPLPNTSTMLEIDASSSYKLPPNTSWNISERVGITTILEGVNASTCQPDLQSLAPPTTSTLLDLDASSSSSLPPNTTWNLSEQKQFEQSMGHQFHYASEPTPFLNLYQSTNPIYCSGRYYEQTHRGHLPTLGNYLMSSQSTCKPHTNTDTGVSQIIQEQRVLNRDLFVPADPDVTYLSMVLHDQTNEEYVNEDEGNAISQPNEEQRGFYQDLFPRQEDRGSDGAVAAGLPAVPPTVQRRVRRTLANPNTRRKQYCVFCKKHIANLSRHLSHKHRNEERVAKILELPIKDPTRRSLLTKLRVEGYVASSNEVIIRKGGRNYLPCESCKALVSKKNFFRHCSICSGNIPPKNLVTITNQKITMNLAEKPMSEHMKNVIIPGMRSTEEILQAIINDPSIIDYGNSQCVRFGNEINKQKNLIRNHLISFAKIRLGMTKVDPTVQRLADIFHPSQWDNLIEVVHDYALMGASDLSNKAPTNVQQIGLLLTKAAKDIRADMIDEGESSLKRKNIKSWLERFERKYSNTIGWQARKVAEEKKWKARKLVPVTSDILLLNKYLENNMDIAKNCLKNNFKMNQFDSLNKITMSQLLIFNRKRIGEIVTIKKEDFERRSKVNPESDIFKSLSETEKLMSSRYSHMVIRGKLARPVPLLVPTIVEESILLILKNRRNAGVSEDNTHLFAKAGMHYYNAIHALREAAYQCGAKNPEEITSTKLRKHVATISQTLSLNNDDLKALCSFMGHTTRTHIENYRLPDDAVNTAKLSKLLQSFNEGTIHMYRGKTINDIEVDEYIDAETPSARTAPRSTTSCAVAASTSTSYSHDNFPVQEEPPSPPPIKSPEVVTPKKRKPSKYIDPTDGESSRVTEKQQTDNNDEDYVPDTPTPPKKQRFRWTTPEKRAMKKHFANHLSTGKLPALKECHKVKCKEPCLNLRKVDGMKSWIAYELQKKGRKK